MGVDSEVSYGSGVCSDVGGGVCSYGCLEEIMGVSSAIIWIGIGSVTEIDGIVKVIVSVTLDGFGGGVVMVPKGMYEDGNGEGCRGIDEVKRTKLTEINEVSVIGDLP